MVVFRVFMFIIKRWVQGGKCISKARLDGKVAVITGGNTGIGKETARALVKRGAEVHILCRDPRKAEFVKNEIKRDTGREVFTHKLDLSSLKSVHQCVKDLKSCLEKIDILVNNAGLAACPEMRTEEGFELQFGTNHVGHFVLTTELLPLLRRGKARVIVVSSMAHKFAKMNFNDLNWRERSYDPFAAYGQSKLANILFAKELARREQEASSGVTTYSLHPGAVKTEITRHMETSSNIFMKTLIMIGLYLFSKTPENGAQTSIFCAVDESLENCTGKYYKDCKEVSPAKQAENMDDAQRLWNATQELLNKEN